MKLLIHFARFGPYHHARLRSARDVLRPLGWEVVGLETAGRDKTYGWAEGSDPWIETIFPDRVYEEIPAMELHRGMHEALQRLRPDAVAIAGWGFADARAALDWCGRHGARAILMSETRAQDGRRAWWKEWWKSRLVRRFDAALVGGRAHRDYLVDLGMPADRIHFGYDVVDNEFFRGEVDRIRADLPGTRTGRFFLASNRFIGRKNLALLIRAYHGYVDGIKNGATPWSLCLLGDGPLKAELVSLCGELGLPVSFDRPWESEEEGRRVFFPGFCDYASLPEFYARAGCFVHPALQEPWGLVLNEAAASGLPLLGSQGTGAAAELVHAGVNGWTFDPRDARQLTALLERVAHSDCSLGEMGLASQNLVEERAATVAFGHGLANALQRRGENAVEIFWKDQAESYTGNYADLPKGTNFNFRTRLARVCELTAGCSGNLLDCATGSGEITAAVLRCGNFERATLVDVSPSMLALARQRIEQAGGSAAVEWVNEDVFACLSRLPEEAQFDVILCLGLIAHTGRLEQLLDLWRPRLKAGGAILLQSTLLDHPGTKLLRLVSAGRHLRRKGYAISYYSHRDIIEYVRRAGLEIQEVRRFGLGIPYGDRIHAGLNFRLETGLQNWTARHGADAIYRIGHPS